MSKQPIVPADAMPSAGPYSPGIRAGNLVFVSGQGPFDTAGNLVGDDFATQARATFANVERVLREAGAELSDIVRIGCYLKSLDDFAEWNAIMAEYLPQPYPARTTIPCDIPNFLIEIDAIAVIPDA